MTTMAMIGSVAAPLLNQLAIFAACRIWFLPTMGVTFILAALELILQSYLQVH